MQTTPLPVRFSVISNVSVFPRFRDGDLDRRRSGERRTENGGRSGVVELLSSTMKSNFRRPPILLRLPARSPLHSLSFQLSKEESNCSNSILGKRFILFGWFALTSSSPRQKCMKLVVPGEFCVYKWVASVQPMQTKNMQSMHKFILTCHGSLCL